LNCQHRRAEVRWNALRRGDAGLVHDTTDPDTGHDHRFLTELGRNVVED
jgi:hypothetical protein